MKPSVIGSAVSPSISVIEYSSTQQQQENVLNVNTAGESARYLIRRVGDLPTQTQLSPELNVFCGLLDQRDVSGDVTIICANGRHATSTIGIHLCDTSWDYSILKAHKNVLIRSSAFFCRYFQSLVRSFEPSPNPISFCVLLPNISAATMTSILELFYTGKVYLKFEDFLEFWNAADILKIRHVEPGIEWQYSVDTERVGGGYDAYRVYHQLISEPILEPFVATPGVEQTVTVHSESLNQPPVLVIGGEGAVTLPPSSTVVYQIDSSQLESTMPGVPVQVITEHSGGQQVCLHYPVEGRTAGQHTTDQPVASTSSGKTPTSSTSEKMFSCELCPSVLRSKKSYTAHMYRHKLKEKKQRDTNNNSKKKAESSGTVSTQKKQTSTKKALPHGDPVKLSQPPPQISFSSRSSSQTDSD